MLELSLVKVDCRCSSDKKTNKQKYLLDYDAKVKRDNIHYARNQ